MKNIEALKVQTLKRDDERQEPQEWPEVKPLKKPEDDLPKLTESDLSQITPTLFLRYIANVSTRMSVGFEFVAGPLFSILAGVVGRRVGIRPKLNDTWTVFLSALWGMISAPPGSKKSAILSEVRRFPDQLEDAAAEEYAQMRKKADAKLKSLAQKQKAIEKKLFLAHEENNAGEVANLERELAQVSVDIEAETPKQKRYTTSDSTSAKLAEIMVDNPSGIIAFRDEIMGLFQSFLQMGNEGLRALFLEMWAGTGRLIQDRVSAGTRRAKNIAGVVVGSTQPDKLAQMVDGSDDGLIQRFGILLSMPDQDLEETDLAPDPGAVEQISQFCQELVKLNGEKPLEATLSENARELFRQWNKSNSELMRDHATPPALKSHLAKYPALICGLAGLFELAVTFEKTKGVYPAEISHDCLAMAAEWIETVFLPHARFVYGRNVAQSSAEKLAQRIRAGHVVDKMAVRSLERKNWEGLSSSTLVRYALEELEERGWLRLEKLSEAKTGRPSERIRLNPKLKEGAFNA